jgi:putative dimethyl sulfoxide reductase chaperone
VGNDPFLDAQRARGECFRLLAACFYPPQPSLWKQEALLENLTDLLTRTCPGAAEHARRMRESLSHGDAEELAVEHARLFVGPQRVIAPPYGSVYLEEGRRVMGESTRDAVRAYEEAGLRLDADFKELPDHVAVELEFAYYLTSKGVEAAEAGNAEEARSHESAREAFLDRHLRRWVPQFCTSIAEGTENAFYSNLAKCLAAFVAQGSPETNKASR